MVKRAGCFVKFVFLMFHDCCVALPHGAMGLSAVCDCGITVNTHFFKGREKFLHLEMIPRFLFDTLTFELMWSLNVHLQSQ